MRESEKKILHDVGLLCRDYRIASGQTLKDVSIQMGYSISTIGYFERGHNNSAKIMLWYVEHYKIPMEKIMKIFDLYTWGVNHE